MGTKVCVPPLHAALHAEPAPCTHVCAGTVGAGVGHAAVLHACDVAGAAPAAEHCEFATTPLVAWSRHVTVRV